MTENQKINWVIHQAKVIEKLREALRFYAYPDTYGAPELFEKDICRDDCAGYYRRGGEIAREALNRWN